MALITCPECGRQISDRAPACLGCGIPMEDIRMILKENEKQSEVREPAPDNSGVTVENGAAEVKCLHCSNPYNASALKCPKCSYPLLTLFWDSGKINKSYRREVTKADTDRLKGIRIKCVICENEYEAAALKCPKCRFPALAITGETQRQSGIIDSYRRANGYGNKPGNAANKSSTAAQTDSGSKYSTVEEVDQKIKELERKLAQLKSKEKAIREKKPQETPSIAKYIIESEKEFFRNNNIRQERFVRNMNRTLDILGSGWREYKPRKAEDIIVAKNKEIEWDGWKLKGNLLRTYQNSQNTYNWDVNYFYMSWSMASPYVNYNLISFKRHLALMKEEGYDAKLIERKDALRILSEDNYYIDRIINRLSDDYTFPAGLDVVKYELAYMMMQILDDGTGIYSKPAQEHRPERTTPSNRTTVKTATDSAAQSADTLDIRALRAKAIKGEKQAMIKLADLYKYGKGVTQSTTEAEYWYKQAEKIKEPSGISGKVNNLAEFETCAKKVADSNCSSKEQLTHMKELTASLLETVKAGSADEKLLMKKAEKVIQSLPMNMHDKNLAITDMFITSLARLSDADA